MRNVLTVLVEFELWGARGSMGGLAGGGCGLGAVKLGMRGGGSGSKASSC